jgi:hypothetical protein
VPQTEATSGRQQRKINSTSSSFLLSQCLISSFLGVKIVIYFLN